MVAGQNSHRFTAFLKSGGCTLYISNVYSKEVRFSIIYIVICLFVTYPVQLQAHDIGLFF
jgi:hypothetical protein